MARKKSSNAQGPKFQSKIFGSKRNAQIKQRQLKKKGFKKVKIVKINNFQVFASGKKKGK